MRIVFKHLSTIADAKRTLWADPDMLIELAAEIRERNAREAEAWPCRTSPYPRHPCRPESLLFESEYARNKYHPKPQVTGGPRCGATDSTATCSHCWRSRTDSTPASSRSSACSCSRGSRPLGPDGATYRELKAALEVSDGALYANLNALIAMGYLESEKVSVENKELESYRITTAGPESGSGCGTGSADSASAEAIMMLNRDKVIESFHRLGFAPRVGEFEDRILIQKCVLLLQLAGPRDDLPVPPAHPRAVLRRS